MSRARRERASAPQPSSAPYVAQISTDHQPREMPEFGRHTPRARWTATPTAATATATGNLLRWATCSAPSDAAGVAAGETAARRVAARAPEAGHHSRASAASRLTGLPPQRHGGQRAHADDHARHGGRTRGREVAHAGQARRRYGRAVTYQSRTRPRPAEDRPRPRAR